MGAPAGPLAGAAQTRPDGWLPNPLTTDAAAAQNQARPLIERHHPAHAGQPLRCLAARYRSHTLALGPGPEWVFKRHADEGSYLAETMAYQLLANEGVLPELVAACDASRTLITTYLPTQADLRTPKTFAELVDAVAAVHTAPSRWPGEITATMAPWRLEALTTEPYDWVRDHAAWRRLLQALAHAHGPDHIPIGNLDLKADHARRHGDGRLGIIDAETMRPYLTGMGDLVVLAHLATELGHRSPAAWVRWLYVERTRERGASWTVGSVREAVIAYQAVTGLHHAQGLDR